MNHLNTDARLHQRVLAANILCDQLNPAFEDAAFDAAWLRNVFAIYAYLMGGEL